MKNKELKPIIQILSRIPITRIQPPEFGLKIARLIVFLNRLQSVLGVELQSLYENFFSENKERAEQYIRAVETMRLISDRTEREREALRISSEYKAESEKDEKYSLSKKTLLNEEVEIDAEKKIDIEVLLDALRAVDMQLTAGEILALSPILKGL